MQAILKEIPGVSYGKVSRFPFITYIYHGCFVFVYLGFNDVLIIISAWSLDILACLAFSVRQASLWDPNVVKHLLLDEEETF